MSPLVSGRDGGNPTRKAFSDTLSCGYKNVRLRERANVRTSSQPFLSLKTSGLSYERVKPPTLAIMHEYRERANGQHPHILATKKDRRWKRRQWRRESGGGGGRRQRRRRAALARAERRPRLCTCWLAWRRLPQPPTRAGYVAAKAWPTDKLTPPRDIRFLQHLSIALPYVSRVGRLGGRSSSPSWTLESHWDLTRGL